MKALSLFLADLAKQKRSLVWALILILPLGANAAMCLDMALRYQDYLFPKALERGVTSWHILLWEHHHILGWGMWTPLFVALIAAFIYYPEYHHKAWKHLLSLPVPKSAVYLSKWANILFYCLVMVLLDAAGLIGVGFLFHFPEPLPLDLFARYTGLQFAAILSVTAAQNWLSSYYQNLIKPVTAGFAGAILTYSFFYTRPEVARWIFYTYPTFAEEVRGGAPEVALYGGLTFAALILLAGWLEFRNRDIVG